VSQLDRSALLSSTFAGAAWSAAGRREGRELASRWLDRELSRIDDVDVMLRFARACPLEGVAPEAYAPRWLAGPPGVLAGIRFKGGDVTQPFVELIAWDAPIADAGTWREVLGRLRDAFTMFAPSCVRVRWPGDAPPPGVEQPLLDQWLVAERLAVLRDGPSRPVPQGITVGPVQDVEWFPQFAAEFASWRAGAGELGDEVFPAERADLQGCLDGGAVICLWDRGSWLGIAAARREDERDMAGYGVLEEFLAPNGRGRGYAKLLQQALIAALEDTGSSYLWGTVHAGNAPSLAAARSVGRDVREGWWFLPIPDDQARSEDADRTGAGEVWLSSPTGDRAATGSDHA
jgi:L-amino acid N-acyltransferase YncA